MIFVVDILLSLIVTYTKFYVPSCCPVKVLSQKLIFESKMYESYMFLSYDFNDFQRSYFIWAMHVSQQIMFPWLLEC